ncbi:MAG: hypothetical protein H6721_06475 [Sandaracinus sp.]|nr:hypothetical protein [Sandaracinus sp.]MCB9612746.1 hypothetical protein [Sandaracinus sp.]MCB9631767.1 hypothetical protein [Sandaracinus sp.]
MTLLPWLVAAGALSSVAAAGYLAGVRLGHVAREGLRRELAAVGARASSLERALAETAGSEPLRQDLTKVRADLEGLARAVAARDETWIAEVRGELDGLADKLRRDESELAKRFAPAAERARLAEAVAPEVDATRRELPELLSRVARAGGFATVLLADESGLLLGASPGADHADEVAGTSALLLSHADRVAQRGMPRPRATLVHDDEDRLTLHRTLRVGERRYVLTAVARHDGVDPRSLDPVVEVLERVLARDAWSA